MRHLRRAIAEEQGQALVLALVIVVIGLLLGIGAVAFALNVSGSGAHDEQTRSAQQAADTGIQTQLFNESDSDAVGFNLSGGTLGLDQLLDCNIPEFNNGVVVGTVRVAAGSSGVCPPAVSGCTTGATVGAGGCLPVNNPWQPVSNESETESELFPNATAQTGQTQSSGSSFAVEFPQVVSLGCHTTNTATPASACNTPTTTAGKTNAYFREMALLKPTAPLQALEGENDVTVNTPLSIPALISGNIVAGHNLTLPGLSAPVNTSGVSLPGTLSSILSGQLSALGNIAGLQAVLDYGFHCNTSLLLFGTVATDGCSNPLQAPLTAKLAGPTGGDSNKCTAGTPTTNCFLERPGFDLDAAISSAGAPGCPVGKITLPTGATCNNGFLNSPGTGTVTLSAGTYVFCGVNIAGPLASDGSGPVQVFVAGPNQDNCSNALTVSASVSQSNISAGTSVSFTDASSGGTGSYTHAWNFGDVATSISGANPNTSTLATPTHVYNTAGTYVATETVTDGAGDTASYNLTIVVGGATLASVTLPQPTANATGLTFSATPVGGTGPYSYSWHFGGPGVVTGGTTGSPTVQYSEPGTFTATVTVTDSNGSSATAPVTVQPASLAVTLNNPGTTSGGVPFSATFPVPTVTGGYGDWQYAWFCGNVTKAFTATPDSTIQGPTCTYNTAGSYVVALVVTDAAGQHKTVYSTTITVTPSLIALTNGGLSLGLTASAQAAVTSPSPPELAAPVTAVFGSTTGGTAGCSSKSTYTWAYGDGGTGTGTSPTHIYPATDASGVYAAGLTFVCHLTLAFVDVVVGTANANATVVLKPNRLTYGTVPTAATTSGTGTLGVSFTGGTPSGGSGTYSSYSWDFGDGTTLTTATSQSPAHTYTSPGFYTATETVTDSSGATTAYGITITVNSSSPGLTAHAVPSAASGGVPLVETFTDNSSGGLSPYTCSWNFGDGLTSASASCPTSSAPLSHTFTSAGTYVVTETVTDSSTPSLTASYQTTITVTATPVGASTGGSFVVAGGINNAVTGLVNGSLSGSTAEPSAFQIYLQGDPSQTLVQGTSSTPGTTTAVDTVASIGGGLDSAALQALVVYAPRSNVTVNSVGLVEGSLVGWNVTVNALGLIQDLDLGNYPLSSVINAYQVQQTVECSSSVAPLQFTTADLAGC